MQDDGLSNPERAAEQRADRRLLELIVCPQTKSALEYNEATQELVSRKAGLAFPIRNGVPLMTLEAARPLTDAEIDQR